MVKRFDLVGIRTIRNVVWVSGPATRPAKPQGSWSVVGNIGKTLVLARNETIIQIPIGDVYKMADYSIEKVINGIKDIRTMADLNKHLPRGAKDGEETKG